MTHAAQTPSAVLDFHGRRGTRTFFKDPQEVITTSNLSEVRAALREVERAARAGLYAVGFVAYEAAPAFDRALSVREASTPLVWFGLFDAPERVETGVVGGGYDISSWVPSETRDAYERNVREVREAIARGNTYQVNYTFRLRTRFRGDAFAFYERLRAAQPTRFGAYLDAGRFKILSASPELFFRRRGSRILTRPMKGTAARGRWAEDDDAVCRALAGSEKNRAENIMIVDLLRNDLGRVAETGTVRASSLFRVERHPTVFQMTSVVGARLRGGATLEEIFAALFPCGSVTGAPKVSTMRLIARLESSPRGVYCGAVGCVEPGGDATFNVPIRTVVVDAFEGTAEYGTGGGVTWDSTPSGEYEEALEKARLLTEDPSDFELLETLRLEGGLYHLLEEHLARLNSSARYFDFSLTEPRARAALAGHASAHASRTPRRVRLLVSRGGGVRVESRELEEARGPQTFALARTPVDRRERFLYHKTTRRGVYDSRRAERPGLFDVLLQNEEGELTEFTNGNLVLELEGRRWTPPRGCGLLAGTFRESLLRAGEISERVLTKEDLSLSSRVWFINGVRGWVEVTFDET
ncbi:MAG TPA: aminodeoxychorismate synthase component I [Pyrinomonadaceae bacterium]|nr:aminodeoxychorismate synthase component I [Pyrinomonadaceae bacterium]